MPEEEKQKEISNLLGEYSDLTEGQLLIEMGCELSGKPPFYGRAQYDEIIEDLRITVRNLLMSLFGLSSMSHVNEFGRFIDRTVFALKIQRQTIKDLKNNAFDWFLSHSEEIKKCICNLSPPEKSISNEFINNIAFALIALYPDLPTKFIAFLALFIVKYGYYKLCKGYQKAE